MPAVLEAGHGSGGSAACGEDVIHQQQGLQRSSGWLQAPEDLVKVCQPLLPVEVVLAEAGTTAIQGGDQPVPPLPGQGPGQGVGQIAATPPSGRNRHDQQRHPQVG
jgi:hypothetical protein